MTFRHLVVFAKPYCKVERKAAQNYNSTIDRPSYMAKEEHHEKQIFLNGQIQTRQRPEKRKETIAPILQLKALHVVEHLGLEG